MCFPLLLHLSGTSQMGDWRRRRNSALRRGRGGGGERPSPKRSNLQKWPSLMAPRALTHEHTHSPTNRLKTPVVWAEEVGRRLPKRNGGKLFFWGGRVGKEGKSARDDRPQFFFSPPTISSPLSSLPSSIFSRGPPYPLLLLLPSLKLFFLILSSPFSPCRGSSSEVWLMMMQQLERRRRHLEEEIPCHFPSGERLTKVQVFLPNFFERKREKK